MYNNINIMPQTTFSREDRVVGGLEECTSRKKEDDEDYGTKKNR